MVFNGLADAGNRVATGISPSELIETRMIVY
jgi:hypothetical protein